MRASTLLVLAAVMAVALGDVYLHFPRGQNDRCDEKSNDRRNANRMFNSQNNAAGGYGTPENHELYFYPNTVLRVEWYSQHSCGNGEATTKDTPTNPEIDQCQHVIQLGCEDDFKAFAGPSEQDSYRLTDGMSLGRPCVDRPDQECANGNRNNPFETFGSTCTNTRPTTVTVDTARTDLNADCPNGFIDIPQCNELELSNGGDRGTFNSDTCECSTRKLKTYGYHEPEHWWVMCRSRDRNRGLWTSTQNVNNNRGATADRQEPNSARYGFECPEEKDYYPYWHPTPWRDLAIFTSNTSMCDYYLAESQNQKDKCHCIAAPGGDLAANVTAFYYNNKLDCESAGAKWSCFGSWNWDLPVCRLAAHQPDNRLGNIDNRGDNDESNEDAFANFEWNVPENILGDKDSVRCLIRVRYNISTAEVAWNFDATNNRVFQRNNPVHTYGQGNATLSPLQALPVRMAINTAQYGRTFEDRTYIFEIRRRPAELSGATIHNLNVRGKRGNIAQVRNCVEYDFVPNNLHVRQGDYVHFQWDGTDYNDNNNAGEGRAGTDRNNVVELQTFDANLPRSINRTSGLFTEEDLAALAWVGQDPSDCFSTQEMLTTQSNANNNPRSCHFLNGPRDPNNSLMPTPYFDHMAQVQSTGTFYYMSSRNNNFSNRSQKGTIVADNTLSAGAIAGIVIGVIAGVALIGAAVFLVATKKVSFSGKFKSRV